MTYLSKSDIFVDEENSNKRCLEIPPKYFKILAEWKEKVNEDKWNETDKDIRVKSALIDIRLRDQYDTLEKMRSRLELDNGFPIPIHVKPWITTAILLLEDGEYKIQR